MDTTELNPELFRNAAVLVAEGHKSFACNALSKVTRSCSPFLQNAYQAFLAQLFRPPGHVGGAYWGGEFEFNRPKGREVRVFALLLAADILEGGGL